MSETCSVCGAPLENGKCTYCGATSQNQGSSDTKREEQPTGQNQSFYQQAPYNGGPFYTQGQAPYQGAYTYVTPGMNRPITSRKSRLAALLFCLFLGPLGIHYFYVGKVGMGLLYLFTCGLCGLGILVNLIQIVLGSFRDQFGYPLLQW